MKDETYQKALKSLDKREREKFWNHFDDTQLMYAIRKKCIEDGLEAIYSKTLDNDNAYECYCIEVRLKV